VLGALSDYPIPLNAGIFGLLDRQAVDSINSMQERNRYLPGLRAWVGYPNAVVYYDRQDRAAGDGKLSFVSRIKYAMDAITSFSYKPLRLCFVLTGFSLFMVALLGILAIFSSSAVSSMGFGVASAIFLVGSLMLLCLGVIGEYLGRVYDEVRGRPLSIINKVYYASEMLPALSSTEYEDADQAKIFRVA
jgi:dolichol-phosphate mannosyltransferase